MKNQKEQIIFDEKENSFDLQLVIFKIADEEFGVNINEVKEIIRWEEVTKIPNTVEYVKGVINLRGSIVVVNDLAVKLGLQSKQIDDESRILVVEVSGNTVGLIVDSATEVMRLGNDKVRETPDIISSNVNKNFINGIGVINEKRLLTLLDLSQVIKSNDSEAILQVQRMAEKHIVKN